MTDINNESENEKIQEDSENIIDEEIEEITCQEMIISENYIDLIVNYEDDISDIIRRYNSDYYHIIGELLIILYIPIEELINQDLYQKYNINILPSLFGPYTLDALEESGVLFFHNHPFVPLRGTGTIVGIVDSGIDYTHPAFIYEDNTTKIISIWDQTIQGNPPKGYCYGTEYTSSQINEALQSENPYDIVPQRDNTGHGTFLAGVAAGKESETFDFIGVAPDAEIIMVKLKQAKNNLTKPLFIPDNQSVYQENDIIIGINYLLEKATEENKPIVIILGIGSNMGTHDGTNNLETYLDNISTRPGVVIVIAAGNEGNTMHHYSSRFEKDQEYIDVIFNIAEEEKGVFLNYIINIPDIVTMTLIAPNGFVIPRQHPKIKDYIVYTFPLEITTVTVKYELANPFRGTNEFLIIISNPLSGLWTLRIYSEIIIDGRFDIWLPREGWVKEDTRFINADPYTTITVPATSNNPIAVGGYNHINDNIYISTSRGLTRDNRLKPDMVAPGVDVYGPLPNNQYGIKTGTSIAAAITGGIAALLLEWGFTLENDTTLDSLRVNILLIRGTEKKETLIYPNRVWGFGQVNLFNTFDVMKQLQQ